MVLQQNEEIAVWGWAEPGDKISIRFLDEGKTVQAGKNGRFEFVLGPFEAGGPHTMTLAGSNEIILEDIYIGEVWLCSGQSNMEWPVNESMDHHNELRNSDYPLIRLFQVPRRMSTIPQADLEEGSWEMCDPGTVANFSAVGYFFGRELFRRYQVPVGLVQSTWGGTNVQTWMSRESFAGNERYEARLSDLDKLNIDSLAQAGQSSYEVWKSLIPPLDQGSEKGRVLWADPGLDDSDWDEVVVPGNWEYAGYEGLDGIVYLRKQFMVPSGIEAKEGVLQLGPVYHGDQTFVNGYMVGEIMDEARSRENRIYPVPKDLLESGANNITIRVINYRGKGGLYGKPESVFLSIPGKTVIPLEGVWKIRGSTPELPPFPSRFGPNHRPTLLFNGMIHPLIPFTVKGVIWYQGESNSYRPDDYRDLFAGLITDWREKWGYEFPFLFVQLAPYKQPSEKPEESGYAEIREAQRLTLEMPLTGMAVTTDIGDAFDIHPRNKQEVGRRLALAARKIAYHEDLVHSGPLVRRVIREGDKIRVEFEHAEGGMGISGGSALLGFELAGDDGIYHKANAVIEGSSVLIMNDGVKDPVCVRYAWADNPADANLINREGLPASPFRICIEESYQ